MVKSRSQYDEIRRSGTFGGAIKIGGGPLSKSQEFKDKLEGGEEEEEDDVPNDVDADQENTIVLPTHMKVVFSERSCLNKVLFSIYRIMRFFFVAVWFYFIPFVAMFASYAIPWYFHSYHPLGPNECKGDPE